jgi:hypothetical protein
LVRCRSMGKVSAMGASPVAARALNWGRRYR